MTLEQFIAFVRTFEEQNHFDFNQSELYKETGLLKYDGTFRDEDNYKCNVTFSFEEETGVIDWNFDTDWEDARQEVEDLYQEMFPNNPICI